MQVPAIFLQIRFVYSTYRLKYTPAYIYFLSSLEI